MNQRAIRFVHFGGTDDDDLMSSIAWFTLPLNRAQVVVSMGTLLLAGDGEGLLAVVVFEDRSKEATDRFSVLFDRLRVKKPAWRKSRFHIDSSI